MLKLIASLIGLLTLQYFFKAFITLNFNILFGGMIAQFYRHAWAWARHEHSEQHPLRCPECKHYFNSLPD